MTAIVKLSARRPPKSAGPFSNRLKQERKMATQNSDRLETNRPGGSLTLGGDTTVNRLGFGAMRLCGPGVWGKPLDLRVPSAC